jgi:hypothetical protein
VFDTKRPLTSLALLGATVLAISSLPVSSHTSQPSPWSPGSTASYQELVNHLKAGRIPGGEVDLTQVRMKYAASREYDPEFGSLEINEMYQKLNEKDYQGALKIANAVLAKQYVNIDAHRVAAKAYDGLHDDSRSKLNYVIALGLTRSILKSGGHSCVFSYGKSCGTSIARAYKVISVQEEDALARYLRLRPAERSSLYEDGRSYDEVKFVDTNNNSIVTLYFDITLTQQRMHRSSHS